MRHEFNCDNCDKLIITGCFDQRDIMRIYKSPVVDYSGSQDDFFKRYFASASTLLCIECIKQ